MSGAKQVHVPLSYILKHIKLNQLQLPGIMKLLCLYTAINCCFHRNIPGS